MQKRMTRTSARGNRRDDVLVNKAKAETYQSCCDENTGATLKIARAYPDRTGAARGATTR